MFSWLRRLLGGSRTEGCAPTDTSPGGVYTKLRGQALAISRSTLGFRDPPADAPAWGLLMETGYPRATATLFVLIDGTASLYLSSGGGVIGGQDHEPVRRAAAAFVAAANDCREYLVPAAASPVPAPGQTTFYVRTDAGILTASAQAEALERGLHPLAPLYYAGDAVITELRLIAERRERAE